MLYKALLVHCALIQVSGGHACLRGLLASFLNINDFFCFMLSNGFNDWYMCDKTALLHFQKLLVSF